MVVAYDESFAPAPHYISLDLEIHVCARPDAFRGDVKAAVLLALIAVDNPDGSRGFFHPVATCAIGAVLDARCRVIGRESLVVADASAIPSIPRANTHLTALALAERVAEWL